MNKIKKITLKYLSLALIACGLAVSVTNISSSIGTHPNDSLEFLNTSVATNYTINKSITYEVILDYAFQHTTTSYGYYWFKMPRFDNRGPESIDTPDTPPYQESTLMEHEIVGNESEIYLYKDKFNNKFDIFNQTSPSQSQIIGYHAKYNITVNQITFGDIDEYNPIYDYSDPIFDLYCNNTEQYFNISDPDLIYAAYNECNIFSTDTPVTKARKICEFANSHITFNGSSNTEYGASVAYERGEGDCSEFTDLAITLLRIHKIPARKVHGFIVGDNLQFQLEEGYHETNNLNGHVWLEYYVPNIGWISCEPQDPSRYKISYCNILEKTVGAWFEFPNFDGSTIYLSEWGGLPVSFNSSGKYVYMNFTVIVIDVNINMNSEEDTSPSPDNSIGLSLFGEIGILIICSVGFTSLVILRKKQNC